MRIFAPTTTPYETRSHSMLTHRKPWLWMHHRSLLIAFVIAILALVFYGGVSLGVSIAISELLDRELDSNHALPLEARNYIGEYYAWSTGRRGGIRQRLAEYKPYVPDERWNRNIIQSWKTPITTSDGFFESWERHNPNFKHILFNDTSENARIVKISGNHLPEINRTYSELLHKKVVLRSDFFRYVVIWADGGIWADVDTWAQRPFDAWISLASPAEGPHQSLASLESNVGMIVGLECVLGEGGQWTSLAQYIFAAKQGHPVLLETIARIVEKAGDIAIHLDSVDELRNREVLGMTGPEIFTDLIAEWIKKEWDASFNYKRDWRNLSNPVLFGDILVLPVWAFGSGVGLPNTFGWDDPRICAGHRFLGSWVVEGLW